jgi:hypothetical protein
LAGFECVVAEHPIWTRSDAWLDEQADKLAVAVARIIGTQAP